MSSRFSYTERPKRLERSDLNFETKNLSGMEKHLLIYDGVIPVGTVCFKAADWFYPKTTKVLVDSINQEEVTMYWNDRYFLDYDKAEIETNKYLASEKSF